MRRSINSILQRFFFYKRDKLRRRFNRVLPANELFTDRWEKAKYLGFGERTSIYDSAYVFGDVKVGRNTWIGPNTVLDGTGGITIGDNCSFGAGSHIYTHDTLMWAVSGGKEPYTYKPVSVGDHCFISVNVVILPGITVGTQCVLLASSMVTKDVPDRAIVGGNPAKQIGEVLFGEDGKPELKFYSKNG